MIVRQRGLWHLVKRRGRHAARLCTIWVSGASVDDQELDLRGLIGLLQRRWRMIALTLLLVSTAGMLALAQMQPVYQATALVLVDPGPRDLLTAETQSRPLNDTARVESEVEIIRSDTTLLAVIAQLELLQDTEFGPSPGWWSRLFGLVGLNQPTEVTPVALTQNALNRLRAAISVERRGLTYVIAVSVRSGDPFKAARIANALANAYIRSQLEARITATLSARDIIAARLDTARATLTDAETAARTADPLDTGGVFARSQAVLQARSHYQTLSARLNELEAQSHLQLADSRIVSEAFPPGTPSAPDTILLMAITAVTGLGLGLTLALLYENVFGGFTSRAQMQAVLRAQNTASLPRHRDLQRGQTPADLIITAPLSGFAEAIRRLQVSIDQTLRRQRGTEPGAVVLVTSVEPGEGKSTTALALARTYALGGRTVLLIDADLRQPGLHRLLGLEPDVGLLEYLAAPPGSVPLMSVLAADPLSGVRIALGAHGSDTATDHLLGGEAFARMLAAARQSFDIIILDASAAAVVVDPLYLAPHADAIALLIRWAGTGQQEARVAVAAIDAARRPETEIITVLSLAEERRVRYRRRLSAPAATSG